MKNNLDIIALTLPILVYILVSTQLLGGINVYIVPSILWFTAVIILLRILRIRINNYMIMLGLMVGFTYIAINTFAGFIKGFGLSPFLFTPFGITINAIYITLSVICFELVRFLMLGYVKRYGTYLQLLIPSLMIVILSIPLAAIANIEGIGDLIKFIVSRLVPILAKNMLATYLIILYGPIASIVYMLTIKYYTFFTPILPNLDWLTTGVMGVISTIVSYIVVLKIITVTSPAIKVRKFDIKGFMNSFIPIITVIAISWFLVGVIGFKVAVVASNSMSPTINVGDLVISTKSNDINIGDIIEYWDFETKSVIAHRVVDIINSDGRQMYITKGDANREPDLSPIVPEQVIGKVIFVIPKIGWLSLWVKTVINTIVSWFNELGALVIGSFMPLSLASVITYRFVKENGQKKRKVKELIRRAFPIIIASLICLSLVVYVSSLPEKEVISVKKGSYRHSLKYNHVALLKPNIIYNKTIIKGNETIYTPLLKELNITLTYTFNSKPKTSGFNGVYTVDVVIEEEGKWSKKYMSIGPISFNGNKFTRTLSINFTDVTLLVKSIRKELNLPVSGHPYNILVIPHISVNFTIHGKEFSDEIQPVLTIGVDGVSRKVSFKGKEYSMNKDIKDNIITAKIISIGGFNIDVISLKYATYIASASMIALIILLTIVRGKKISEKVPSIESILDEYKDIIINVNAVALESAKHVVEIASFDELVKVALNAEKPILHRTVSMDKGKIHEFYVITDIVYSYKVKES